MDELKKKVSYLRGFADGLSLDETTPEGKVLVKLMDIMEELADTVDELERARTDAEDRLEEIECGLEDLMYELDTAAGYDDEDEEDDDAIDDLFDDEEDDQEYFEIECPHCHEDIMVDFDMIDEGNSLVCPLCNKEIELKIEFGDDEDDEEE